MYSVIINDRKFTVEDGAPLREVMSQYGAIFPCGGVGRCGKCRITCDRLPITDRDRRFLTENLLESGVRLACDKTVCDNLVIRCDLETKQKERRALDTPSLAVRIDEKNVEIGILDDELAESVVYPNPLLVFGGIAGQSDAYIKDPRTLTKMLRACIGKAGVEFFEAYGKAKAETTAICTDGFYLKILLGVSQDVEAEDAARLIGDDMLSLPTESIYVLPYVDAFIGADILCETAHIAENSVLIDCSDDVVIVAIDKENSTACRMWDVDYSPLSLLAIRAAMKVMTPEGSEPTVYLYGERAYDVEEILMRDGYTFIHSAKDLAPVAKACVSARFRARLEKEKQRTSVRDLLKDESFQEALTALASIE